MGKDFQTVKQSRDNILGLNKSYPICNTINLRIGLVTKYNMVQSGLSEGKSLVIDKMWQNKLNGIKRWNFKKSVLVLGI